MYVFWFLPVLIAAFVFVWAFFASVKKRPVRHPEEEVVVDKPPQKMLPKWYREKGSAL